MGTKRQSRRFVFTWNNFRESDVDFIKGLQGGDDVTYCICGREVGESGTPHLQGYIELGGRKTVGGLKRLLQSQRPHIEVARGSSRENYNYCSKQGEFFEYGTPFESITGEPRGKLVEAATAIREGATLLQVAQENPSLVVQYYRGFQYLQGLFAKPRNFKTHVIWLYGRTGLGKSREAARDAELLCRDDVCWLPDATLRWFDGYAGNRGVIIDEFAGGVSLPWLNRLFDRYPLRVPIKGGFTEWRPRFIWITSQSHPSFYYPPETEEFYALTRRLDELKNIED